MAFNIKELANLGHNAAVAGEARTLWMYANSAEDNIDGAGFFNPANVQLRPGDLIIDCGTRSLRFVDTITSGVVALDDVDVAAPG